MIRLIVAAAASIALAMPLSGTALARDNDKTKVHIKPLFGSESSKDKAAKKGPYGDIIAKYAKQYGVPVSLAHAVVRIESNFNPKARGSAGEVGLMQIKPATARSMGYSGSVKGLYDPDTNIRFGMKYLAAAHQLGGGETCRTILKYNAGHGAKRMNPVSKRYCGKVMALLD
ncbi:lytic transglycosylase domain-containing protein [Ciceribacter sp. L1K23]|uniref:lytic transglycosylase domain-containing protein n=1 Tax=unclassified Ciceribacter TaxID=2628820 RepID=UPI001ABDF56A|nr:MULTISPECIES: lytic transglycosylase domain-containing protein [unclassified Ciceribacter]MBO3760865.1 lytic transglycosylase domain-containing protein [Ciceribacter sp. L1K22]MBR0555075.1 lytic transglycosylase domain-containing protein [Ciceribacter sp. L1K23]